jgi:ATP-dependent DNA helicase RecQ
MNLDNNLTPKEILKKYFGYNNFRSGQEEIIHSVIMGEDSLVVMPTGGGKSLCFQVPAMLLKGITVVVSPLIALMKDQVDSLEKVGIKATTINSTLEFGEVRQRMTDIRYGLYKIVYVAPERFESKSFVELLSDLDVSLFAVDEAHCISDWGHDFRPSYIKLKEAIENIGRPTVIALTATATPKVQEDIVSYLGLLNSKRFVRGFDRPNLRYNVKPSINKINSLVDLLKLKLKSPGSMIIYCGTRKTVENVGSQLLSNKLPVTIYHAGLKDDERNNAQTLWINSVAKIIVATNAFGMGIDKYDVRDVIHFDLPGSLEAYYQEAGRAGRDGLPSDCTLLFNNRDRGLQEFFIRNLYPERDKIEAVYNALWDSLNIGIEGIFEGVFLPNEDNIAFRGKVSRSDVNSVINLLEKNNIVRKVRAEKLAIVQLLVDSENIKQYYSLTRVESRKLTIMALLRTIGSSELSNRIMINTEDMANKHGLTIELLDENLRALMMNKILVYTPPNQHTGVQFISQRIESKHLQIDENAITLGRERALFKLNSMEEFAKKNKCRRDIILEYFCAEIPKKSCGFCDYCRNPNSVIDIQANITPRISRAMETFLACVVELNGKFGLMTYVDILIGITSNKNVFRFKLNEYKRFSELNDFNRQELAMLANGLLDAGLLKRTGTDYPIITYSEIGIKSISHLNIESFF